MNPDVYFMTRSTKNRICHPFLDEIDKSILETIHEQTEIAPGTSGVELGISGDENNLENNKNGKIPVIEKTAELSSMDTSLTEIETGSEPVTNEPVTSGPVTNDPLISSVLSAESDSANQNSNNSEGQSHEITEMINKGVEELGSSNPPMPDLTEIESFLNDGSEQISFDN